MDALLIYLILWLMLLASSAWVMRKMRRTSRT